MRCQVLQQVGHQARFIVAGEGLMLHLHHRPVHQFAGFDDSHGGEATSVTFKGWALGCTPRRAAADKASKFQCRTVPQPDQSSTGGKGNCSRSNRTGTTAIPLRSI